MTAWFLAFATVVVIRYKHQQTGTNGVPTGCGSCFSVQAAMVLVGCMFFSAKPKKTYTPPQKGA
jgi:hypothetical protein